METTTWLNMTNASTERQVAQSAFLRRPTTYTPDRLRRVATRRTEGFLALRYTPREPKVHVDFLMAQAQAAE